MTALKKQVERLRKRVGGSPVELTAEEISYLDKYASDWRTKLAAEKPIPVILMGEPETPTLKRLKRKLNIHVVSFSLPT